MLHLGLGFPLLSQHEQAAQFDPTNPNQRQKIQYTQIPGGYSSIYYNQVPATGASLNGVAETWASVPEVGQAAIVLALGAAVGFFGWRKFGGSIKGKLGLSGSRRRRR